MSLIKKIYFYYITVLTIDFRVFTTGNFYRCNTIRFFLVSLFPFSACLFPAALFEYISSYNALRLKRKVIFIL